MKKSLVVVLSVSLLVLAVSGLSYAYFKNYGITKEEHLSVVAKKLAVIFTDNSELTGEIYPGYEETKTFSVENKSESLFKYNIIFEDLVNTFITSGFLQYRITSEDGGFSCDWTDIPKSNEPTDVILAYSIEIENGEKHNYKLEIRYQNSETENQSADMGRVLSGNLAIKEGTKNPKLKQVTLNIENGTPEASTMEVLENNDATFEVNANEGYTTKGAKLTCDNEYNATINEETISVTIPNITSETNCTLKMKKDTRGLFYDVIIADNQEKGISTRSTFNTAFTGTARLYMENDTKFMETGVGQTKDVVYYYAGNTDNNWVKFGKNTSNVDFWWRIIRTNEDGSIRLLYAGSGVNGHASENGYIYTIPYNSAGENNTRYVGYMYGEPENGTQTLTTDRKNTKSSTIKNEIDNWYEKNLANQYGIYVSKTAIYCNDRATPSYKSTDVMNYAGYIRLAYSLKRPSFKCGNDVQGVPYTGTGAANVADKFTAKNSDNVGNEQLTYPIALMTADEVVYAGGVWDSSNDKTYYSKNSVGESVTGDKVWWTMTPARFGNYNYVALFTIVASSKNFGMVNSNPPDSSIIVVRPVLSLKYCVEVTGTGITSDPYIPTIDSDCALADN